MYKGQKAKGRRRRKKQIECGVVGGANGTEWNPRYG